MTVLTTIPNGASMKDIRDTINAALADIALLKQGGSVIPTPTVAISGALSKPEGISGATLYVYTVTRSATTGAVNVPWSFAAGGTDAADFTGGILPAGGTVAMAAGVATGTITISVNGDTTVEGDETFTVSITAPAGYAAGSAMSATGTILNDDAPSVTYTQPYNRLFIAGPGDSRAASGSGDSPQGTYGGSGITSSTGSNGVEAFMETWTDHRIRHAPQVNFGIGGQNLQEIFAVPRFIAEKGITAAAAHEAAIMTLYAGTNNTGDPASLGAGGAGRTIYQQAIRALTDPAYVYPPSGAVLPLYQGRPKNLVIFNETRAGVAVNGAVNHDLTPTNAAAFHDFATWLKTFDYASGHANANPRVIVIDTFDDARLADLTDTSTYKPKPGYFIDGLHLSQTAAWTMAQIAAAKINAVIPADVSFASLPTTDTVGSFFLPNPLFTGTGSGAAADVPFVNGSTAPPGTRMLGQNTGGLSVDVTRTPLGGNLGNALNIRIFGTPTATGNITMDQGVGQMTGVDAAQDRLRLACRMKLAITAGRIFNVSANAQLAMPGGYANRMFVYGPGDGGQGAYGGVDGFFSLHRNQYADNSHDWMTFIAPDMDLRAYASGAPDGMLAAFVIGWLAGEALDVTVSLSQFGVSKAVL